MLRHVVNPNNTTSSGQDHSDPRNRSSSWWDRSWQSQGQWYDRSWQDNRDWDNRTRSAQPTSSTETSGRRRSGPTRTSRFTQDRNRRGHGSVAATQRRIDRGQDHRRQAEQAAQQAQAATQTEPQQGDTAPPEPSRPPRVSTSERRARSAPPPGQAALEANEEAEISLVPRKDRRRRDKAETKAEPQEPIPEEELEEVLEEELPASSSVRVPTPPRAPDEHYTSAKPGVFWTSRSQRFQKRSQPRQLTRQKKSLATRQKLSGEVRSRATIAATRCARSLTWKPPGKKQKL